MVSPHVNFSEGVGAVRVEETALPTFRFYRAR
nr:MAG TPA: hypothetical protein [Caudoviricetes sp.]